MTEIPLVSASSPLRGAIIDHDRHWSAIQLERLSAELDKVLVRHDPASLRVAIACESLPVFMAATLAVLRAGAVAVPLSDQRPRPGSLAVQQFAERLADADVALVFADAAHATSLRQAGYSNSIPTASGDIDLHCWQQLTTDTRLINPEHAALLVYTSGSTGRAKAAIVTFTALAWIAERNAELYHWRDADKLLAMLPLTHLAGLCNAFSALQAGVEVIVAPSLAFPKPLLGSIYQHHISVLGAVPYQLAKLSSAAHSSEAELSPLRLAVCSAAPLSGALANWVLDVAPNLVLRNAYGLSEAFRSFVGTPLCAGDDPAELGRPQPGVSAELRDPHTGLPMPDGEVGELWLRGPNVSPGYWRNPQATRRARCGDWLRTADLAQRDAGGSYRLAGRLQTLINIGGEKLSCETIEALLTEQLIDDVAVVARADHSGIEQVVAVAERGSELTLSALRHACTGKLAHGFIPSALLNVEQLPRTRTGKPDRRALARLVTA